MKHVDIIILMWHQVYLSSNAGGYVRLREFLKRFPSNLSYILFDNNPSIYPTYVNRNRLFSYSTLESYTTLRRYVFLFWLFLETITAGVVLYRKANQFIEKNSCKLLYVPIGEFPQLYLPAILLKKKYPSIKLVVDILNYQLPDDSPKNYYYRLRQSGAGVVRSCITLVMFYIGFELTNTTIRNVDFIFTVSPQLVREIKKIYRRDTIDFTPSGIDNKFPLVLSQKKKYVGAYVGRMTVQKGIFDLLLVWKDVVSKKRDAKLALAGTVDKVNTDAIKRMIQQYKLDNSIDFYGEVTEKRKNNILSDSGLFIHLARYEPLFPVIGILEGFSHGLPAVIFNMPVVSAQNLAKYSNFLYIIPNGDIHAAARMILAYIQLPTSRKHKNSQQAKKFADKYDWNAIAKKEFDVFDRLIKD